MADPVQNNSTGFNTISSQTLQPQPKLVIPTQKPDTTPYQSLIDGALTSLPTATAQVDAGNKSSEALLSRIAANSGDLMNKTQYTQDQQDLAGVNARNKELEGFNAQFHDIAAQIKGIGRASQAAPLQVQQNNLGTGATDAGVAPQEAGMLRENAIKALTLGAQADVLGAQITNTQARLASAKEKAQQGVDLKFKPLEEQNAMLKDMLELNQKYIVDPAEKKKTEATAIALAERTRLLAKQKEDEKTNNDLIINAQSQLAPPDVIERAKAVIDNGGSTKDVIMSLGKYAGEYQKALLLKEQIEKEKTETAKLKGALTGSVFSAAGTGAVAPNGDNISIPNDTMMAIGKLKLSEGQANAVAYVSRMIQADKEIDKQIGTIKPEGGYYETSGYDPTSFGSGVGRTVGSDNSRKYNTNAQDFIRAKLRKESGATISPSEFEGDAAIYTPSGMGLDEKDLQLARTKRAEAIKSMIAQAGPAAPYLMQYYSNVGKAGVTNKFQQAMGVQSSQPVTGTAIISGTTPDGGFNFNIPK